MYFLYYLIRTVERFKYSHNLVMPYSLEAPYCGVISGLVLSNVWMEKKEFFNQFQLNSVGGQRWEK